MQWLGICADFHISRGWQKKIRCIGKRHKDKAAYQRRGSAAMLGAGEGCICSEDDYDNVTHIGRSAS